MLGYISVLCYYLVALSVYFSIIHGMPKGATLVQGLGKSKPEPFIMSIGLVYARVCMFHSRRDSGTDTFRKQLVTVTLAENCAIT